MKNYQVVKEFSLEGPITTLVGGKLFKIFIWERSGSVVECSNLTGITALCP